jgi:PKD repeat protein
LCLSGKDKIQVTSNQKQKNMKNLTILSILVAAVISFTSCEEDDSAKVDFEVIVTGESPNAIVQLTNTSDEADSFTWTFSEGASVESSTETNPQIIVDKTGEFTITLTATTGTNEKVKTKTVSITGINGIYSYDDVVIGEVFFQDEYGYLLSCETGIVYKEAGLRTSQGSTIDMVIDYNSDANIYIYSPHAYGWFIIPGRTETYFNLNANNSITLTDFNNLQMDQFHTNLEYLEYDLSIKPNELPKIIPFIDGDGKIGLVKIQEIFPEYLLMDVKVQKYVASE